MPGRSIAGRPYPDDDGSADPRVSAALAAYTAGRGSEHSALTALADCRLLVPLVATLTEETGWPRREKVSEMALPTLIGHDGRPALLAFTCLDSLARWRPDARPVAVPASQVWRAGAEEAIAVVIDVAGPVPVAVDGARLTVLASGGTVPVPHEDPDVVMLVRELVAREHVLTGFRLLPGKPGTDMTLHATLAPGNAGAGALAQEAIGRVVAGIMAGAGPSVRRGLTVAVSETALADRKEDGQ